MNRFSVLILLLITPYSISNATDQNTQYATVSTEDTTDTTADTYEPINSEEAFDPQKEYADMKNSFDKLYKIPGSSILPQYIQQQQQARSWHFQSSIDDIDNDELIASTNSNNRKNVDDGQDEDDDDDNDETITTTFSAPIDAHTTNTPIVNALKQMDASVPIETTPNNAAVLMMAKSQKPYETVNPIGNQASTDEFMNHAQQPVNIGMDIQHAPVIFYPNDSGNNNNEENTDYVNDDANGDNHETNNSQPITLPYSMETTITSLPSSPIFISTRPPSVLFTIDPLASTNSASSIPSSIQNDLNGTNMGQAISSIPNQQPQQMAMGKKSAKKIEALTPHIYKYSADEIIRKYLDDTFIRAPLATLINTAPEPLRKAKMLWKSALRPNTAIDIVLVAFNSSGKRTLLFADK